MSITFVCIELNFFHGLLQNIFLSVKSRIAKVAFTHSTMQPHIVAVAGNANLKRLKNF